MSASAAGLARELWRKCPAGGGPRGGRRTEAALLIFAPHEWSTLSAKVTAPPVHQLTVRSTVHLPSTSHMAGFEGECFIGQQRMQNNAVNCNAQTDESMRQYFMLQKDPPVRCVHQDSVAMSLL